MAVLSRGIFGEVPICAGVLIAPKAVLTTASCVDGSTASSLKVRIGSLQSTSGGTTGNLVTRVSKNPNYNTNTFDSDLAILTLARSVESIEPAVLASVDAKTGEQAIVLGWGVPSAPSSGDRNHAALLTATADGGKPSPQLLQKDVQIINADDCNGFWDDINLVTGNMLRDKPLESAAACSGDGGGPIISESYRAGCRVELLGCRRLFCGSSTQCQC